MINPEGVRHQIHGNVIQSTSRVLKEQVTFSDIAVTSRDWGTYPLLTFPELPAIDVLMVPRPEDEPLGVGESASVPSAAAIANAIFDATGVRFREPPFTPDRILAGLARSGARRRRRRAAGSSRAAVRGRAQSEGLARSAARRRVRSPRRARRREPADPAARLRPSPRPDPSTYSAETIERGQDARRSRRLHRLPHGGRRTRRSPAAARCTRLSASSTRRTSRPTKRQASATGPIGPSRARCARASRGDGRHLFPAFPYTSFAKASEADLQALYAFLMAQPAVVASRTVRRICARPSAGGR